MKVKLIKSIKKNNTRKKTSSTQKRRKSATYKRYHVMDIIRIMTDKDNTGGDRRGADMNFINENNAFPLGVAPSGDTCPLLNF